MRALAWSVRVGKFPPMKYLCMWEKGVRRLEIYMFRHRITFDRQCGILLEKKQFTLQ